MKAKIINIILAIVCVVCLLKAIYGIGYGFGRVAGVNYMFEVWEVDKTKPYIFQNTEENP